MFRFTKICAINCDYNRAYNRTEDCSYIRTKNAVVEISYTIPTDRARGLSRKLYMKIFTRALQKTRIRISPYRKPNATRYLFPNTRETGVLGTNTATCGVRHYTHAENSS